MFPLVLHPKPFPKTIGQAETYFKTTVLSILKVIITMKYYCNTVVKLTLHDMY